MKELSTLPMNTSSLSILSASNMLISLSYGCHQNQAGGAGVFTFLGGALNPLERGAFVYVSPTAPLSTSFPSVTNVVFILVSSLPELTSDPTLYHLEAYPGS